MVAEPPKNTPIPPGRVPDGLTTIGRLLQLPPLPEIPEPLRGKSFAIVEVIHCGDPAEADKLLAPLRALEPTMDTLQPTPVPELGRLHMDPDHPVPAVGDGLMLDALPADAVDEVVRARAQGRARRCCPLRCASSAVRSGDRARSTPRSDRWRPDMRCGPSGLPLRPSCRLRPSRRSQSWRMRWHRGRRGTWSINFAETRRDPETFWTGEAYARLRRLKEAIDPGDLFRSNHPVLPAQEAA